MKSLLTKTLLTTFTTYVSLLPSIVSAQTATYYSDAHQGQRMANGQFFFQSSNSVAHSRYKLGTRLQICHQSRCVIGVVRDRCRCSLDLSKGLFSQLAPLSKGRINVSVKPL
jgi:rare lipoprotein A (peptidoglycan hydrolase)